MHRSLQCKSADLEHRVPRGQPTRRLTERFEVRYQSYVFYSVRFVFKHCDSSSGIIVIIIIITL